MPAIGPVGARRLENDVVILTGAVGGIGRAYARRLAHEGARLSLVDVDGAALRSAVSECRASGAEALGIEADVSDPAAVSRVAAETMERFGRIDALVNNAALFSSLAHRPFEEIPPGEIDRVLAVNVRGPFLLCQAVAPHMRRQRRGKIVNIASGIILSAAQGLAHYVASKGAVFALTRALANELGRDGVTVNSLSPGLTVTDTLLTNTSAEAVQASRRSRCLERDEVPEDLEGTLVYLLSPDSDFVTGQMLVVNGGAQFW